MGMEFRDFSGKLRAAKNRSEGTWICILDSIKVPKQVLENATSDSMQNEIIFFMIPEFKF
jgi:hypothetical protein